MQTSNLVDPADGLVGAKGRCEGAEVGYRAGSYQHIASQVIVGDAQRISGTVPSVFLTPQSADQFLRTIQFLLAKIHLLF